MRILAITMTPVLMTFLPLAAANKIKSYIVASPDIGNNKMPDYKKTEQQLFKDMGISHLHQKPQAQLDDTLRLRLQNLTALRIKALDKNTTSYQNLKIIS